MHRRNSPLSHPAVLKVKNEMPPRFNFKATTISQLDSLVRQAKLEEPDRGEESCEDIKMRSDSVSSTGSSAMSENLAIHTRDRTPTRAALHSAMRFFAPSNVYPTSSSPLGTGKSLTPIRSRPGVYRDEDETPIFLQEPFVSKALIKGRLRNIVATPKGIDRDEWIAVGRARALVSFPTLMVSDKDGSSCE